MGVFMLRAVQAHTFLGKYRGERLDIIELLRRYPSLIRKRQSTDLCAIGKNLGDFPEHTWRVNDNLFIE